MDAEHCRLCGDVIDENGGDGLCSECYFSNADVEWLAENYPHLLADDADESADSSPRRNPHPLRSRHATTTCGSNSATSRTATGHHQGAARRGGAILDSRASAGRPQFGHFARMQVEGHYD